MRVLQYTKATENFHWQAEKSQKPKRNS